MRKVLYCILVAALFMSCRGTGSVDGNVYWKYNNYVGNRPDGGSEVYLFPSWNNDMPLEAKCDVQGNFNFDGIPTGRYTLVVVSESTNENPKDLFEDLVRYGREGNLGFNFNEVDSALVSKTIHLGYEMERASLNREWKKNEKLSDGYFKLFRQFIKSIPDDCRFNRAIPVVKILPGSKKIHFENVEVEAKNNKKIVVDFGNTYSS